VPPSMFWLNPPPGTRKKCGSWSPQRAACTEARPTTTRCLKCVPTLTHPCSTTTELIGRKAAGISNWTFTGKRKSLCKLWYGAGSSPLIVESLTS